VKLLGGIVAANYLDRVTHILAGAPSQQALICILLLLWLLLGGQG
jgi:hypothetical protein